MRLLLLAACILPYSCLMSSGARESIFGYPGWAAIAGSPLAVGICLIRIRDKRAEDRGSQDFGPYRSLLRDILTQDRHAAAAATALVAVFAGIVALGHSEGPDKPARQPPVAQSRAPAVSAPVQADPVGNGSSSPKSVPAPAKQTPIEKPAPPPAKKGS
jgi:hypothetical protein